MSSKHGYKKIVFCFVIKIGSSTLTGSQFRHCPKPRSLSQRLPIWIWLLVAFGAMLLLLLLLGGVLKFIRGSKSGTAEIRTSVPDARRSTNDKGNENK